MEQYVDDTTKEQRGPLYGKHEEIMEEWYSMRRTAMEIKGPSMVNMQLSRRNGTACGGLL